MILLIYFLNLRTELSIENFLLLFADNSKLILNKIDNTEKMSC